MPDLGSASDRSCHMGNLHKLLNQKHYPDLGNDALSVWNFCTSFSKSFPWETSGGVPEGRLSSQAILSSSSVDIFPLPSLSALPHCPSILPFSFLFLSHFLPLFPLPLPSSPPLFFFTPSLFSYSLTYHPLPSSHRPFSYPVHIFFPSFPLPYLTRAAFNIWCTFVLMVCNRLQVHDVPPRCSLLSN